MYFKNNPGSMFFVVVVVVVAVVCEFHIDLPFKAFDSNVVLNAANVSCALLHCNFCNAFIVL